MNMTDYAIGEIARFEADMEEAGYEVYHYHGRNYWHGPAVDVDRVWEAETKTTVKVQSDSLGLGYVVYPVIGDPSLRAECQR